MVEKDPYPAALKTLYNVFKYNGKLTFASDNFAGGTFYFSFQF